ncbi:hypothetical protein MTR_1g060080 [Medicago truncatula]|uniref:Uncharacterized protein n=1 Tax=Medicago truncatula TaxID=3880 RepID=A0A072VJQ1_MEDTR|nr:hypothetical protein MTR_1g060080 [Medicago truncatula]
MNSGCDDLFHNFDGKWLKGSMRKIGACDVVHVELCSMLYQNGSRLTANGLDWSTKIQQRRPCLPHSNLSSLKKSGRKDSDHKREGDGRTLIHLRRVYISLLN